MGCGGRGLALPLEKTDEGPSKNQKQLPCDPATHPRSYAQRNNQHLRGVGPPVFCAASGTTWKGTVRQQVDGRGSCHVHAQEDAGSLRKGESFHSALEEQEDTRLVECQEGTGRWVLPARESELLCSQQHRTGSQGRGRGGDRAGRSTAGPWEQSFRDARMTHSKTSPVHTACCFFQNCRLSGS